MSDVLSPDDVTAIVNHMNEDHSDAVAAYITAFTAIGNQAVTNPKMTGMDNTGIDLSCMTAGKTTLLRVEYSAVDPALELRSPRDARAVLVKMVKIARNRAIK